MVTLDEVGRFLGIPNVLPKNFGLFEQLIKVSQEHIVNPIKTLFNPFVVTPIVNQFTAQIVTPITSSFVTGIINPLVNGFQNNLITPISNATSSLINSAVTSVNTYFSQHQLSVLNLSIDAKNLILDMFVNPVIKKLPGNPPDDPFTAYFDTEGIHVDTTSLFAEGSYYLGLITYDIFRRFFKAMLEIMQETGDWFNDNIAGTEIVIPIPFFSGKSFVLATKINDVWVPNNALNLPVITDWNILKSTYPYFDMWPYNVKLYDKQIFSNPSIIDSDTRLPTPYKRSDLVYDFECLIIISVILAILTKLGMKAHEDKLIKKLTKAASLNAKYGAVVNDITYKQVSNKSLLYLLALLTRGSNANKSSVNISLGNISGLPDAFDGLSVMADDDSVELDIKADTEQIIKSLRDGQRTYG